MGRDLEAPATAFEVGTSSAVMEEYFPSFAASSGRAHPRAVWPDTTIHCRPTCSLTHSHALLNTLHALVCHAAADSAATSMAVGSLRAVDYTAHADATIDMAYAAVPPRCCAAITANDSVAHRAEGLL